MRTEIEVYLGDEQLEFDKPVDILFNYKITDNTNPTAIKNSFSKSIKISGTPKNNDIFGNIWDLSRIQGYDGNIRTGFNPLKKTPFSIYVDGNLYESGYAKLNSVTKKNNQIEYDITLFGGIGELFYSLTYKDEDGNEKRTLADLQYELRDSVGELTEIIDMDFTINKETVWDAWNQIMMHSNAVYDEMGVDRPNNYLFQNKWDFINFIPAYEGTPDNFSANKVLMNSRENSDYTWSKDGYSTVNGYALGECNEDLTYNQTRDYRSYLQRPAIRLKEVIKACQNPINNGGWELKLDETFFNAKNPYWEDTWITLDKLQNVKETGEKTTTTNVTIGDKKNGYYDLDVAIENLSEFTNINLGIGLQWNNTTSTTNKNLYLSYYYDGAGGGGVFEEVCRWYKYNSAILLQLVGYNSIGEVVATSPVQYLYSPDSTLDSNWKNYKSSFGADKVPIPSVVYHTGHFSKDSDGKYIWVGDDGKPTAIAFRFTEKSNIVKLKLKVSNPYSVSYKYYDGWFSPSNKTSYGGYTQPYLFTTPYINSSKQEDVNEALQRGGLINGKYSPFMVDAELEIQDYMELFSGTKIRKAEYLTTDNTACDYLTAYAKMFGLYFYRDFNETPSDPKYTKGVIYLMTRNSFYDRENIIDLQDVIDRSREIKILPTTNENKWLVFNTEQIESEAEEEYMNNYGSEYGSQKINTGYNFNGDTKNLLDKVIYKGGIEVLETDKFYTRVTDRSMKPYTLNGFNYNLYKKDGTAYVSYNIEQPVEVLPKNPINRNGWERTDSFPKLQFHTTENDPIDGKDVLVFFKGSSNSYEIENDSDHLYWITDDVEEMSSLNDGSACWLMTFVENNISGNKIAYPTRSIPMFGRNLYTDGKTITHSLDMGRTNMTFVRETINGRDMSIYEKTWKSFIEDLYDDDNRLLSCYVRFENRPNSIQMRKFYWFDNCIWRLNSVKDWNLAVIEPIKCEFVKVLDLNNYFTSPITYNPSLFFAFTGLKEIDYVEENGNIYRYYEIDDKAQTIYGTIRTDDNWAFADTFGIVYEDNTDGYLDAEETMDSILYGKGDAVKQFDIPANTNSMYRTIQIGLQGSDDKYRMCYIKQAGSKAKSITASINSFTAQTTGGTRQIRITFNNRENNEIPYITYLNSSSSWLSASFGVWDDNDSVILTVTAKANSGYARTGSIKLHSVDGTAQCIITVNQNGNVVKYLQVNPEIVEMDAAGGISMFTVETNADVWFIKENSDWILVDYISADGFSIVVNPHYGSNQSGYIIVRAEYDGDYQDFTVIVNQQGGFNIEDF